MKLSVVTVCKNNRVFLPQTIESVLAQDYDDVEYLIVDGGSSDGTVEIIKDYADKSGSIRWISEPDGGISDAMNKGVAMATGDVVAHLHSDDYYAHRGVLSHVASKFKEYPKIRWLTAGLSFAAEDGRVLKEVRVRKYSYRRLLRGNILLHPATFIRRDAFQKVGGFNEEVRYCMDYDLFLRLGAISDPLSLDEQLAFFRVHTGSLSVSQSEQAYAEEFEVRLKCLRQLGRSSFFYRLDYQLKRHLNKFLYQKMIAS